MFIENVGVMSKLELKFLGISGDARWCTRHRLRIQQSARPAGLPGNRSRSAHIPRESLAALLWPDWPDRAALSNLRYALSDLRKVIGDRTAEPPFLLISREAIQFNAESDHSLDVAEFTSLVDGQRRGAARAGGRRCTKANSWKASRWARQRRSKIGRG